VEFCISARNVWGCGSKKLQKCKVVGQNFMQIFKEVPAKCDTKEVEFFAMTARRLWLRCNAVIHGEKFMDPNKLLRAAIAELEDYHRAHEEGILDGQQEVQQVPEKWSPPPTDFVKMNWDAAIDKRQGRVGLGCCPDV
jgi:hypothetical protein